VPEWDVPGYTGLKVLGSGGFGDVVLARHDVTSTLVAIKYLRPNLLSDPEFTRLFRAEAEVLAQVEDPHVVRLYEYVESPDGAAIVMELVDGVSLREILSHQGATTAEAALVVLQGSLLGLAAAHQRGVVHRDYKPENVLVNGDGDSKLTDFGIAARAGDSPIPAGTMVYAPPEQFSGSPATPASDVYAATATFYECLAGRPPFTGNTAERLLYQHLSEPVPLDPVPEPLRPLVTAGMAKDPRDRPADGTTFVTALTTIAEGSYGPDWAARGRSDLGAAALLLAALWPSGAAPAVQGSAVQQVNLSQPARHAATAGQARHLSPEARHRWHLRHLWHLAHLRNVERRRAATAATAAAVVVAAGVALAIASLGTHGLTARNTAAALHLVTLQAPPPSSLPPSSLSPSPSPSPKPTVSSPSGAAHVPPPILPAPSSTPGPSQRPVPSPSPTPKPTPTQKPSPTPPQPTSGPILTPHPFTPPPSPKPTPPPFSPSPSPSPSPTPPSCGDDC
jgi:eukaryotic-like serine/threonine-protein kinase